MKRRLRFRRIGGYQLCGLGAAARRAVLFCPMVVSPSGKNKVRPVTSVPLW